MYSAMDVIHDGVTIVTYGVVSLATAEKQLTKLQRWACVCITGAACTCPNAALEVIQDLTSPHVVVKIMAKRAVLVMTSSGLRKNCVISTHKQKVIGEKLQMILLLTDNTTKKAQFGERFKISLGEKCDFTLNGCLKRHTV